MTGPSADEMPAGIFEIDDAINGEDNIEGVLVKRRQLDRQQHPDLSVADETILKNGPKAYKVARHLRIVDRNTGEVHHDALTVETYRRERGGWLHDPEHAITLENTQEDEIGRLHVFLHAISILPEDASEYLIVPRRSGPVGEYLGKILSDMPSADMAELITQLIAQAKGSPDFLRDLVVRASQDLEGSKAAAAALNIARFTAAIQELEWLIESDAKESEFQSLLTKNPWMFGSEYSELLDRRNWIRDAQQDFMLRRTADGFLETIEIKTPIGGQPLFLKDPSHSTYYPRRELSIVLGQVAHYLEELDAAQYSIQVKDKESVKKIRAKIIIGRDGDSEQVEALRRFNGHLHRIELLTYDQLARIAKQILKYLDDVVSLHQH